MRRRNERNTVRMTMGGQAMRQRKREKHRADLTIPFVSALAFFSHSLSLFFSLHHVLSPDPCFCRLMCFVFSFSSFCPLGGEYELPSIIYLTISVSACCFISFLPSQVFYRLFSSSPVLFLLKVLICSSIYQTLSLIR